MNRTSLTKIVLSAYLGIAGCTSEEPAEAVGKVKYGFCDLQENSYNLRLTNAEVYLEKSEELRTNMVLSAYHPECDLFQRVPEGTWVKVVGNSEYDDDMGTRIWSRETYRLDTEELIYPVEKDE